MFSPSTVSISKVVALWSHGSRKTVDFSKVTIPVLVLAYSWYTAVLYWYYSLHDDLICSLVVAILREIEREFIFCTKTQIRIYGQRWSRGHKARGQGQRQKKKKFRGQEEPFRGQTLSRPRTGMLEAKVKDQGHNRLVFSKKSSKIFFRRFPKKGIQKFFSRDLKKKKTLKKKFFQPIYKILTIQKRVLSSSRGQANFRGLEASRPKPRTSKWLCPWGRPRGQGRLQGLHPCLRHEYS